ncbi:hypothetical protein DPEC_G00073660 [Dallia pectoralis]|uniref:Uncharacterized protein n=1 Tax=Dallia pectoralis TaxID=75939 RepID=A0ACC2H3F6_DALPE|nr:hypothetical protein DPEC_G00073660 [Dallia pectoralis]
MFGQTSTLPIDALMGIDRGEEPGTIDDWVQCHQTRLQEARASARRQMEQAADARKRIHGPATRNGTLPINQLVYRKNHSFRRRHKIQDVWMPIPYRVISQPDLEKPVYTVVPVDGSQAPKNIHRMELRPCGPEQGPSVVVQDWRTSMDTGRSTTLMDAEEDELGAVWVVRQHPQRGPSPESPHTREAELSLSVSGVREKGSSEPLPGISSSSESDQAELEVPPVSPVQLRRSKRKTAGKHSNPT